MKLLNIVALGLATAAALLSGTAFAQATSTFNVNLTLTPKCYVNMAGTPPADGSTNDVTLPYESFQSTHAESSTSFNVTCTNGLGYSIAVSDASTSLLGINYHLKLVAGTIAAYSSTGDASLASLSGSGSAQAYTIGVRAPSGQVGTCAGPAACPDSKQHTITVSY